MDEICFFAWWKLQWVCETLFRIDEPKHIESIFVMATPINEAYIYLAFLVVVGILGSVMVEMTYQKFEWFMRPLFPEKSEFAHP